MRDKKTWKIRLLTPVEMERIRGFPSDWTKECLVDGEKVEMPVNKRGFMMGNALVVDLVNQMEKELSDFLSWKVSREKDDMSFDILMKKSI